MIQHREAVDVGHAQIEQNRGVTVGSKFLDGFRGVAGGLHGEVAPQDSSDQRAGRLVVVDDQYVRLVHFRVVKRLPSGTGDSILHRKWSVWDNPRTSSE